MTTKTTYLLGLFAVIVLGTLLYLNLCSACVMAQDRVDTAAKESVCPLVLSIHTFSIKDGEFAIEVNDNFNFRVSTPSFLMPISEELKNGVSSLRDYLDANPEKEINIIGFYTEREENTTSFSNLGLARANSVKNHLAVSGISSERIHAKGQLMGDMALLEDVFWGPVSFHVLEKNIIEQESQ
ncbi:MAG: hypothetical protein R2819_04945 [Allomuricauda sp.]